MAGKWKEYRKKRAAQKARTLELKKLADLSSKTQGIGMKMPKGLSFNKSGGKITPRMSGGQVVSHGYD